MAVPLFALKCIVWYRDAVWIMDSDGPNEACVIWGSRFPRKRAILGGKTCPSRPMPYDTIVSCANAKTAEPIEIPCGLWAPVGSKNHVWDPDPRAKGQFLWERTCKDMLENTFPWAVQKWLNRSRCRLGCGLGWAQRSMCYIHIGGTRRIRLKRPSSGK